MTSLLDFATIQGFLFLCFHGLGISELLLTKLLILSDSDSIKIPTLLICFFKLGIFLKINFQSHLLIMILVIDLQKILLANKVALGECDADY